MPFSSVFALEEEPLCMSTRVNVILHKQIILAIRNFLSKIEISTLKFWLKKQGLVSSIDFTVGKFSEFVLGLRFKFSFIVDLLLGLLYLLLWRHPDTKASLVARFLLVDPDEIFDI